MPPALCLGVIMRTIEFEGREYEYDEEAFYDWKLQRTLSKTSGPAAVIATSDALFEDSDFVAETLGNDIRKMDALVSACLNDIIKASETAKN